MEEKKSDVGVAQNSIRHQISIHSLQGKTPILRSLSDGRLKYSASDVQISKHPRCNSWKGFETSDLNTAKHGDDKCEVTVDSSFLIHTSASSEDTKANETTLEARDDVSEGDFIIQQTDSDQSPGSVSQKELWEDFFTILSGLYGIFLSVIGVVVPIVETFQFEERSNSFIGFYVFIYLTSIMFLLYAYLFLLHNQSFGSLKRTFTRHTIKRFKTTKQSHEVVQTSVQKMKKRRIVFKPHSEHHTGSFYLRLGAVGFGIGCMLLDGLYFLEYFEPGSDHASCSDAVYTLRPLFNLIFTFSQLYFVFLNSQMHIVKHRLVAKFGLIHMTATNICIWCRTIVVETMNYIKEVDEAIALSKQEDITLAFTCSTISQTESLAAVGTIDSNGNYSFITENPKATIINCEWSELIGSILQEATPYLYPFKIEFSFICAGILFVMWRNIYGNHGSRQHTGDYNTGDDKDTRRYHRISVDCAGSSRGLFLGILLFVAVVLSIIAFFNIMSDDLKNKNAVILSYSIELFIYILALICIVVAAGRMRYLKFDVGTGDVLEETMILISMTGLYIFASFSIIAGLLHIHTLDGILAVITNLSMVAQATVQTIFMMATMRMSAKNMEQVRQKPGRELVTFLLLCNFTMWIVNSFETQKPQHDPIQLEIYGPKAWAILVHITFPLAIFYRFHSTVCISHVWKQAWKMRNVAIQ